LGLDYTLAEICPSGNWVDYCKESKWGLAAGYEAAWQMGPTVDLGCGLEYLFPHNYGWDGDRSYLSVFASSRWRITCQETKLYLLAQLGWALHEYEYGVQLTDWGNAPSCTAPVPGTR
jgi:hypothetical protein